jgi:hypothetical protein
MVRKTETLQRAPAFAGTMSQSRSLARLVTSSISLEPLPGRPASYRTGLLYAWAVFYALFQRLSFSRHACILPSNEFC